MAISPKKAKENITEQELKDMGIIEAHVDKYLMDNYMGHSIDITLPMKVTSRMAERLDKIYREAGWKSVSFSNNKASLSEHVASSYDGR